MSAGNPFDVVHEPAQSLLSRYGITCRVSRKGSVTWFNLAQCPACKHRNYQCGISESVGADGKLYHGVKCFHADDNPWNTQNPSYVDFLENLGALSPDEARRIASHRSGSPAANENGSGYRQQRRGTSDDRLRPLNLEFHGRLKKRLRENAEAVRWLSEARGLRPSTWERFGLGLSMPYERRDGTTQEYALVYPLLSNDGKFYNRYGYYNIPGVTLNPSDKNGWMPGSARTYFAEEAHAKQSLFVCEGAKDVWRHWQELHEADAVSNLLLITSTHGSVFPSEWRDTGFWERWETVYFGQDSDEPGDRMASELVKLIGREAKRVSVPSKYGKDWSDFWKHGGRLDEFEGLLANAPVVSQKVADGHGEGAVGRFSYTPVDINGAFHNGHLYCTVQTVNRVREVEDKEGQSSVQILERLETVVVRSDRSVHTAQYQKAPRGTRQQDYVLRLSDGTLIDKEPQPNKYGTWSWPSISAYLEGKSKTRPLAEILGDVSGYLKACVWLPYDEDYAVLTLAVPVTYTQAIFDSVPLLLLNGPPGSGKSQMGRAMARVCANAYVCGQSSAASIARFIDESRGFVVLDDLEAVRRKGEEFSDLAQSLKLSYNKGTATKIWTDVKTMRTHRLNFFGVKMINNTQGVDDILATRMIRIQTNKIPEQVKDSFQGLLPTESQRLERVRDELHTWAFENARLVEAEYKKLFPKRTDRADEIAAPLKVMASLAGDAGLSSQLEAALKRQAQKQLNPDDPTQVMREALDNLIALGYFMISITHLVLEMRDLIDQNYGQGSVGEIPEWARPEWVGRQLRTFDVIDTDPGRSERRRLFGANLRVYPLRDGYVEEVRRRFAEQNVPIRAERVEPTAFCKGCDRCPYSDNGCEIMPRRLKIEGRSSTRSLEP